MNFLGENRRRFGHGDLARQIVSLMFCALAAPTPARAIWLSESNGVARLAGPFDANDETAFAAFLAKPRPWSANSAPT